MKRTLWLFLLSLLSFFAPLLSPAQSGTPASGFLDPQSAQKANSHEDELYASANGSLSNGDYDAAVSGFDQVARMKGRRADGALYWKAYALEKNSRAEEALAVIAQLRKEYPRSSYLNQARTLEMEIRPQSPESIADDEMKLYAIEALMHSDPEKAFPALEKVLQGNSSFKVKDRALFVLTQNKSEKAQQLLLAIAKGNTQPELQAHAIRWIAVSGHRNGQALREIYVASNSVEVKKQILRSFIISGDKEGLLAIIKQESSPELRREGIRQLGPMGAGAELRQIYKETTDAALKETILQSMGVAGDAQSLIEIAKTETDPRVRARAIQNVGIFGGSAALPALSDIYNSNADISTKKEVIRALFIHGDAKDMIALARKETNPELKKELVRNLSIMGSPEANEYMMEILNK
ncbi:MAG TPA: HEAT repeat domain-containing protein [Candidatus Angelobacter sp.]